MSSRETAEHLIAARTERERRRLLAATSRDNDPELAAALKKICYEVWTTEPIKARRAALALAALVRLNPSDPIRALSFWVRGIAELTRGRFEPAVENFDQSAEIFRRLDREHEAANTQVAKLIALALLGKYTEAVRTGRRALKIFERYGDQLAAGKIEKNLGNIVARQGRESEAERYYLSARRRFLQINDKAELAMSENNLANTYAELNDFRRAALFYARALENARAEKMRVTEAEIEASLGNLALFRGKFDEALRFLELSRRKYEELKMPHQRAIAELEMADIYLELNLVEEAYEIYRKTAEALRKMKLQGEEARARAGLGRAALIKNEFKKAKSELRKAARLYLRENNPAGAATVKLNEAALELSRRQYEKARQLVGEAEEFLSRSENRRQKLFARWLSGEIEQKLGNPDAAQRLFSATFAEASRNEQAALAQASLNSLGRLFLERNEPRRAALYFKKAVRMVERLRAPLPAEEFRMAFLADKLAPFENLARIYLSENKPDEALRWIEKARARTLSESLTGGRQAGQVRSGDPLAVRLDELREELNWFYSRLDRAAASESERLQKEAGKREKQIAALMRQIESAGGGRPGSGWPTGADFDLRALQKQLGPKKTLVEFVSFDGRLSAFVVTQRHLRFVGNLAAESEVLALLEGLRFQFGALRYGAANLAPFLPELKRRADFYLRQLHEKLLAPLEDLLAERDLVVVPVGAVHYVPFHALFDGQSYAVERREIVYAPSATVWQLLPVVPPGAPRSALLMGFADERIPLVDDEIGELKKLFPAAKTFTGRDASFANFTKNAAGESVLHLACHGQFRPDNPLFSSLHLADGWITVNDICAQTLSAELVTLSACETGLNKIFPGDEILGLARGFLAAGAKSLVLSLWTVSDEATTRLMQDFYQILQAGGGVPAALREAQRRFIEDGSHPYFWSPFMVIGK